MVFVLSNKKNNKNRFILYLYTLKMAPIVKKSNGKILILTTLQVPTRSKCQPYTNLKVENHRVFTAIKAKR